MAIERTQVAFTIGARRLFAVDREVATMAFSLLTQVGRLLISDLLTFFRKQCGLYFHTST